MPTIAEALASVRKDLGNVQLVAVSKFQSVEKIVEAYRAGQRLFGENYVQELIEKAAALQGIADDIEWHFIGHLQTNKARAIAIIPNCVVQTIDTPRLAQKLNDARPKDMKPLRVMIQVNTSNEETKSGCPPSEAPELATVIRSLHQLQLIGLMTIGASNAPAESFQTLLGVREAIQKDVPASEKLQLSMGMSADYPLAIQMGADYVRVGRAIFGERTSS